LVNAICVCRLTDAKFLMSFRYICIEECILTLLVDWNHIDEDYHVMRVKGGSYDYTMV